MFATSLPDGPNPSQIPLIMPPSSPPSPTSVRWLLFAAAFVGLSCAYGALLGTVLDGLLLAAFLLVIGTDYGRAVDRLFLAVARHDPTGVTVMTFFVYAIILSTIVAVCVTVMLCWRPWQRRSLPSTVWDGPGKPLLFPCTTTHTRFFPKRHSFVYSYLVVGVPVGWQGSSGGMVSVASSAPDAAAYCGLAAKGWFHIDASAYLERGKARLGLRGKMDVFLLQEGADPARFPHAYLVTAARFLGYQFNPVSFWYLYDSSKTLAAMILEVNNTFGERRMYLLMREEPPMRGKKATAAGGTTWFTQKWPKDFHVSPFNSRKGSYKLRANDPLAPNMQGTGPISVSVFLCSSHGHDKIVARLFSRGQGGKDSDSSSESDDANGADVGKRSTATGTHPSSPFSYDPAAMTSWQKARFLAAWWWVGFATFPRIVAQAGRLYFQKQLHVWFRPEPLKSAISRLADDDERKLEAVFRLYLRHLVATGPAEDTTGTKPLAVKYIPSGIPDAGPELMLSPAAKDAAGVEEIVVQVLTPVFYTRFVNYSNNLDAFFSEMRVSGTISISPQPSRFSELVLRRTPQPSLRLNGPIDLICFTLIRTCRTTPAPIERPLTWRHNMPAHLSAENEGEAAVARDRNILQLSGMDCFVLAGIPGDTSGQLRRSYRRTVLRQAWVGHDSALRAVWQQALLLGVRLACAALLAAMVVMPFRRVGPDNASYAAMFVSKVSCYWQAAKQRTLATCAQ